MVIAPGDGELRKLLEREWAQATASAVGHLLQKSLAVGREGSALDELVLDLNHPSDEPCMRVLVREDLPRCVVLPPHGKARADPGADESAGLSS